MSIATAGASAQGRLATLIAQVNQQIETEFSCRAYRPQAALASGIEQAPVAALAEDHFTTGNVDDTNLATGGRGEALGGQGHGQFTVAQYGTIADAGTRKAGHDGMSAFDLVGRRVHDLLPEALKEEHSLHAEFYKRMAGVQKNVSVGSQCCEAACCAAA